jgi:outer membrane protein TolC
LAVCGCTAAHYRHSADNAAYSLIAQKSPLVINMEPRFTIEQFNTLELEALPLASQMNDFLGEAASAETGARVLTLEKALDTGVSHSRTYQSSKEQLYLVGLSLSLSRHQFTPIYSAGGNGAYNVQVSPGSVIVTNPVTGVPTPTTQEVDNRNLQAHTSVGVDWLIRDIGRITAAFTTDFLKFVSGNPSSVISSQVGAMFTRPLLRNAGFKTEMENLTLAERNLLYQLRDFTRFRKDFSVQIASAYYGVLGNRDAVRNSYLNFQSSRRAAERTRSLAAEGRTTQADLGRIEQQELSAESAWISAVRLYQRALDDFKIQLGVPVETRLVLDDRELTDLKIHHPNIDVDSAIRVALAARLDYQNLHDQVDDSVRKVKLAKDQLRTQLDLSASANLNSSQSTNGFMWPTLNNYNYSAGLNLDLPLERTAERNNYRGSLIAEQQARRSYELLRDQIEEQIRDSWRTLEQAKRTYEISEIGVKLAERRVEEQELLAELGRAKALDQVDAQNALVSSMDSRTQALVGHTIARLTFWENMGILYIKDKGGWEDLNPAAAGIEAHTADATRPAKNSLLASDAHQTRPIASQAAQPISATALSDKYEHSNSN